MPVAKCLRCDGALAYVDEGWCGVCSQFFKHPQTVICKNCGAVYCIPCLQHRANNAEIPAHLRPAGPRPPSGPEMMHSGGGEGTPL